MNKLALSLYIGLLSTSIFASPDFTFNKLGARANGMGGAFTAYANGPTAILHNWSKKPALSKLHFSLDNGHQFETPYSIFTIENIPHLSAMRFGYIYMGIDDIPRNTLNARNQPISTGETFTNSLHTIYTSFHLNKNNLGFGLRSTIISETLDNETGFFAGIDTALSYSANVLNIQTYSALTIKNLGLNTLSWSTGHKDTVPMITTLGLGASLLNQKLFLASDLEYEDNRGEKLFTGAELWVKGRYDQTPSFAFRAGLKDTNVTLGAGLLMGGLQFDYAYINPSTDLFELEHQFSISKSFHTFDSAISQKKEFKIALNKEKETTYEFEDLTPQANQLLAIKPNPKKTTSAPLYIPISHIIITGIKNTRDIHYTVNNKSYDYQITENGKPINTIKTLRKNRSPLKLILKSALQEQALLIDITSDGKNKITIGGFIPPHTSVIINNNKIRPNKFQSFSHTSTLHSGSNKIDLLLLLDADAPQAPQTNQNQQRNKHTPTNTGIRSLYDTYLQN